MGGPGDNDDYNDHRGDFVKNEITCDYNAGFQGALAGKFTGYTEKTIGANLKSIMQISFKA